MMETVLSQETIAPMTSVLPAEQHVISRPEPVTEVDVRTREGPGFQAIYPIPKHVAAVAAP